MGDIWPAGGDTIVFYITGLLLILIGILGIFLKIKAVIAYTKVEAKVISKEFSFSTAGTFGADHYMNIVGFVDCDGNYLEKSVHPATKNPEPDGEIINVYYNSKNPETVTRVSLGFTILYLFMVALGLVFIFSF